ncbi:hypothetical protein [Sinosporangium siamense]|uniref:Uncharacterized protein n=1 Tax=Sinosporangium siamense TaxID=1367973 RepID=A0A919VAC1_9ACTN|nr:hypothetical protein [Sinosporangium siamense]GII90964.1 hypothetical protein Ssi02_11950 [Sinosporangium siamense]
MAEAVGHRWPTPAELRVAFAEEPILPLDREMIEEFIKVGETLFP